MCARAVYAEELSKLHLGFPLWAPEPFHSPPEIGDVGFVETTAGGFVQLFNARYPANHERNREVPDGYEPIQLDEAHIVRGQHMAGGVYKWNSTTTSTSPGESPAAPDGGFEESVTTRRMVMLTMNPSGILDHATQHGHIKRYCLENAKSWYTLADSFGLGPDKLMFVHGTIKTARWTVAASEEQEGSSSASISTDTSNASISTDIVNGAAADASLHTTWYSGGNVQHRSGPMGFSDGGILLGSAGNGASSPDTQQEDHSSPPAQFDQTVFLRHFRVRLRHCLEPEADRASGDHPAALYEIGEDDDLYDVEDGELYDVVVSDPYKITIHHGLDILLEYLLEVEPGANTAVASDDDLEALTEGGWPEDLHTFIRAKAPKVERHGEGAMLASHDIVPFSRTVSPGTYGFVQ